MQDGSGDVDEPLASPPLQQQATVFASTTTPAPSSSATTGMDSLRTLDSDDDGDAIGPPEETPKRGNETQEAHATDRTPEEKPEQPETPERSAPPLRTTEHARADETAAAQPGLDVDKVKPDDRATPPPTAACDSEGSSGTQSADDHGSSPHREKPRPAGASGKRADVAASRWRLLAFRSFSRDNKGKKPGDSAAGEVAGAEQEKGKERRKRFWK